MSSSDIKRVGEAGIHTIEGNIAGSRAAELTKQREKQAAEYEAMKQKIKTSSAASVSRMGDKFNATVDASEQEFQRRTVGLVSAEDFRRAREEQAQADASRRAQDRRDADCARNEQEQHEQARKEDREAKRRKLLSTLSFAGEEEDAEEEVVPIKKKVMKDPTVDTSFLPDAERERALAEQREKLREEWLQQQEIIKKETIQVTYSYWDGTGHRKMIEVQKGQTIGKFLEKVKAQLSNEFVELRSTHSDDLMYVKEDLIIPQHYSFYDLIVTKARGKSGPLFHFDVHDDVRMVNDARVEKDESHPGKVVERRWYEKNKHIFPASRWELYDPSVARGKYTIHGAEVQEKK